MTSLRSSVRPKSSKQEWGTILEPEFGMGYQKMTGYEVDQTVTRLYYVPEQREPVYDKSQQKDMGKKDIDAMVDRLTKNASSKAVDSKRTQRESIYHNMGVVNSFAWKGYN